MHLFSSNLMIVYLDVYLTLNRAKLYWTFEKRKYKISTPGMSDINSEYVNSKVKLLLPLDSSK